MHQASCLAWSATALAPDGRLAIEAFVPSDGASTPEGPVSVRSIEPDRVVLSVAELDVGEQTVTGQFVDLSEAGVRLRPYRIHYLFPAQLDAVAAEAGLRPRRPVGVVGRRAVHRRQPEPRLGVRRGMNELRWNPRAGQWIATDRAGGPSDVAPRLLPLEADPGRPCPFCPGREDDFPPELAARRPARQDPGRAQAASGRAGSPTGSTRQRQPASSQVVAQWCRPWASVQAPSPRHSEVPSAWRIEVPWQHSSPWSHSWHRMGKVCPGV